jgi:hypothetical protein
MAAKQGRGTTIGVGLESTWGTAVARTKWSRTTGVTLDLQVERKNYEHLHQGVDGAALGSSIVGYTASGNVSGHLGYGQIGFFLLAAIGSVTEVTGTPNVHTYEGTLALPSLTLEKVIGNSTEARVFEGCKVNTLTINYSTGEIASWEAAIVGETAGSLTSAGSPSYTDPALVAQGNTAVTATWNSQTIAEVKRLSIVIDNQLEIDSALASPLIVEPLSQGKKVTVSMTVRYKGGSYNPTADAESDTISDLSIDFNRSSSTDNLMFLIRNAKLQVGLPISTAGVIEQTLMFEGFADGSDSAISVVLTTGNADHET